MLIQCWNNVKCFTLEARSLYRNINWYTYNDDVMMVTLISNVNLSEFKIIWQSCFETLKCDK